MSAVNLQQQIRDNSRELNDFLRDLNDWTGEVKEKDRALVKKDATVESVSNGTAVNAPPPPVRGRVDAHHVKSEEVVSANRQSAKKKNKRRQSSLKDSEAENETSCSSKDMGNACFNKGDYVTAISHYTRCIEHEEGARAAYANRAMCGIKLGRWTEAEADCTEAIRLEPTFLKARRAVITYVKAHQRRGITRRELGRYLESTTDFEQALRLEPNSKILVNERNHSKTAYELEARLRPTQPRRVVKINLKTKRGNDVQTMETVTLPARADVETPVTEIWSAAVTPTLTPPKTVSTMSPTSTSPSSSSSKKPQNIKIVTPRTGAEFESSWNRLKTDPDRRMELMRMISPDAVSSIFNNGVTAPIFSGIIRLCLEGCTSNKLWTAVPILTAMTTIPRFDMAVMFISGNTRKDLQNMWDQAAAASSERGQGSEEQLVLLRKKYKL